jgi:hypothetical protein
MHKLRTGLMDGTWDGRMNRIEVYINGDCTHESTQAWYGRHDILKIF